VAREPRDLDANRFLDIILGSVAVGVSTSFDRKKAPFSEAVPVADTTDERGS